MRELLAQQVGSRAALRLVLLVDLLAPGAARVPDHHGRLRAVLGEDLHQHRGEAEDRVGREPLGRGDRFGQREERPVGERVPVDQEELVVLVGHAPTLYAPARQLISTAPRRPHRAGFPAPRPRKGRRMSVTPSAQYSVTIRVEIAHRPGMLGRVAGAIGDAGGVIGAVDLVSVDGHVVVRDITVDAVGLGPVAAHHGGDRRDRRRARDRHHRPHVPAPRRRQDRAAQQAAAAHARRPLDGLHAGRGARLRGDPRRPRQGLPVHDQAQHRGRGLRRHGGARARRHRPRGGDAGDGGQGDALQGVRRRRRLPDLPGHQGPRRDRRDGRARSPRPSAASTSRTSRRRAASRSRSA